MHIRRHMSVANTLLWGQACRSSVCIVCVCVCVCVCVGVHACVFRCACLCTRVCTRVLLGTDNLENGVGLLCVSALALPRLSDLDPRSGQHSPAAYRARNTPLAHTAHAQRAGQHSPAAYRARNTPLGHTAHAQRAGQHSLPRGMRCSAALHTTIGVPLGAVESA